MLAQIKEDQGDIAGNKAVFSWVAKSNLCLLWFCFTSSCHWLKKLVPLSQPVEGNHSRPCLIRFPMLHTLLFFALDSDWLVILFVLRQTVKGTMSQYFHSLF